ncbi:DUF7133 domain-containing protein [Lignipirellula cremea]|uniref:Cytochrome c domain-containing protein n=1 Tax=Lignipirellula cremea TaxID=2528010 RepID=A0A518DKE2_9BACT|nr:hypothetical protein [Lignipirellula cremea]QDU92298.1 hypothetical protein Pla8534_00430 [Lignipirellula cremea]
MQNYLTRPNPWVFFLFATWIVQTSSVQADPPPSIGWIWDDPLAAQGDSTKEPRYFRRTFELTANAATASLHITADDRYVVYINGQKVGEDGAWASVESYEVAKILRAGKNVLAVAASNGGGQAGLLTWLEVQTTDKKTLVVGSDRNMKASLQAADQWDQTAFDDTPWAKVGMLGNARISPWNLFGGGGGGGGGQPGSSNAADKSIRERLSADEEQPRFILPDGFEIELVAAEPQVINPITMVVDDEGNIYVSESHTYRYGAGGSPIKPFTNPIVRLEPQADGKSYRRVMVAEGFDEPVMGLAIRDGKLWCTANNYLYQFDLDENGKATNRQTLLVDRNKAWNPFGMFVLEWGPDGLLYMSVGNHNIDIRPARGEGEAEPTESISGQGSSGIVMRMNPDGSNMQRLVHGLRVPYSFEYDPFGQLWLLSNGQGNPNRFVRVIDGVDYHCYSRAVPNDWLTGRHPLSPPCFELPNGARTQLLRYYGAAYPEEYVGSLFLDNWGAHGFAAANRSVFRYALDEHNNVASKHAFVSCSDPHFRCSHVALDPNGNLLVADWYGRDDESDLTGRIWRVKYVGKEPIPQVEHKLDSPHWSDDAYAVAALGSPQHRIREQAIERLLERAKASDNDADSVVAALARQAAKAEQPLGAAGALWTLLRIDTPNSKAAIASGAQHPEWRVRRLAVNILRRYELPQAATIARSLAQDAELAVRLEAALALKNSQEIHSALLAVLSDGAAEDPHLRYEAAWHLAQHASAEQNALEKLLDAEDENLRLAGLIALDIACYESFGSRPYAEGLLAARLADPGSLPVEYLLEILRANRSKAGLDGLRRLVARTDLPGPITAAAILALRSLSGEVSDQLIESAGDRLLAAVENGEVQLQSSSDCLLLLRLLDDRPANDFAMQQLTALSNHNDPAVREAAFGLIRKFGRKAAPLTTLFRQRLSDPKQKLDRRLEILAVLPAIEEEPDVKLWTQLLADPATEIRTDAIRSWRQFKDHPSLVSVLVDAEASIVRRDSALEDDLATVLKQLLTGSQVAPVEQADKEKLAHAILTAVESLTSEQNKTAPLLGRRVFERSACVKCHTTISADSPLAPTLKGVGKQKLEYLIESVLHPSQVIKTGFLVETIITTDGKVLSGLVREEGNHLRVLEVERESLVSKDRVDERSVLKKSLMPEGQEQQWSRREFVDLIAYLRSLK